jgi:hypothetical protein
MSDKIDNLNDNVAVVSPNNEVNELGSEGRHSRHWKPAGSNNTARPTSETADDAIPPVSEADQRHLQGYETGEGDAPVPEGAGPASQGGGEAPPLCHRTQLPGRAQPDQGDYSMCTILVPRAVLEALRHLANVLALLGEAQSGQKGCASPPKDTAPTRKAADANQRLENWAIGLEHADSWVIFQKHKGKWREMGKLPLPRSAKRDAALLEAIADKGGFLSKIDAIKIVTPHPSAMEASRIFKNEIKPAMSRLRKKVREALGITGKGDPLPWDEPAHGWRAKIQIGYAVMPDTEHAGASQRLTFQSKEETAAGYTSLAEDDDDGDESEE